MSVVQGPPVRLGATGNRVRDRHADPARASQQVEFVAYGEDCVLSGVVQLESDRLTDMLNDHDEYQLVDVLPAIDDEVEIPALPLSADKGPLLKDFTGALFEGL